VQSIVVCGELILLSIGNLYSYPPRYADLDNTTQPIAYSMNVVNSVCYDDDDTVEIAFSPVESSSSKSPYSDSNSKGGSRTQFQRVNNFGRNQRLFGSNRKNTEFINNKRNSKSWRRSLFNWKIGGGTRRKYSLDGDDEDIAELASPMLEDSAVVEQGLSESDESRKRPTGHAPSVNEIKSNNPKAERDKRLSKKKSLVSESIDAQVDTSSSSSLTRSKYRRNVNEQPNLPQANIDDDISITSGQGQQEQEVKMEENSGTVKKKRPSYGVRVLPDVVSVALTPPRAARSTKK
jgi:hypothetical protein